MAVSDSTSPIVIASPGSIVLPQRKPGDSASSASSSWRSASQINWSMVPLKLPRRYKTSPATASFSPKAAACGFVVVSIKACIAGSAFSSPAKTGSR